jgi:hypothetical protein
MNDAVNAEASDQDLARNLGSRQPESRSAAFGAGILGSEHVRTSDGLSAAQQRYAGQVAAHYMQAGVEQMQQNVGSALSLGVAHGDPRTGTFQGRRYLLTAGNGRSESTSQAQPVFAEDV